MKQMIHLLCVLSRIGHVLSQEGFPQRFQATFTMNGRTSWSTPTKSVQTIIYDYTKLRIRIDFVIPKYTEHTTFMIQHKPEGALPTSSDYIVFEYMRYHGRTTDHCYYSNISKNRIYPFPRSWFENSGQSFQIQPWFALPSNMMKNGIEWIPEIQMNATRYDSRETCNLKQSNIGIVPCVSYFEVANRPAKTLKAYLPTSEYHAEDYVSTIYHTFSNDLTPTTERSFDLPTQWSAFCVNRDGAFTIEPKKIFLIGPNKQDHFMMKLNAPFLETLGDQVQILFEIEPFWNYNGTRCARFDTIFFNKNNWQIPQKVNISFIDYGCCQYQIKGIGAGYERQIFTESITIHACSLQIENCCFSKFEYY